MENYLQMSKFFFSFAYNEREQERLYRIKCYKRIKEIKRKLKMQFCMRNCQRDIYNERALLYFFPVENLQK